MTLVAKLQPQPYRLSAVAKRIISQLVHYEYRIYELISRSVAEELPYVSAQSVQSSCGF